MTNLLNVLKTMETETTGVKNDVINFLLDNNNNNEDLQTHLEDINNYGCESGQVNHLIYYADTVAYFEEHKNEIIEMLEQLGIEDVESWDEMDEEEQMDAIQEYASNIMMYDNNPMELNKQDKNYLAWAIFEYEAVNLENELSEMELIK